MIVRKLDELLGTENEVKADTWESRRFLRKSDKMGFSLHDTVILPGTSTPIWYANHLEAVYCIEGKGKVVLENGEEYIIEAGTMYALDGNEKHDLIAESKMRMVCVFNPPLRGDETHDENGVYPLLD